MRTNLVMLAGLVGCGAQPAAERAAADDASEARVLQCGAVLTADTRLTGDIGPCPGDAVVLGADGVELDCAGHRILGSGVGAGVQGIGFVDLEVRNCTIAGFERHVYLEDVVGGKIEDNRLRGPVKATGAPNCVWLKGASGVEVEDNLLRECRLFVDGSDNNDVVGNRILDGDLSLFVVRSSGNLVAANTIRRCTENGLIDATDNVFAYNLIVGCQSGFLTEEGVEGNLFMENELRDHQIGFFVLGSGANEFRDNDVFGNDVGFRVRDTEGGRYVDNEVRENGIGFSLSDADESRFEDNDITDNTGDGFAMEDSDANTIIGNRVLRNGGVGFRLVDSNDNDLVENESCENADGDLVLEDSFGNTLDPKQFCETDAL